MSFFIDPARADIQYYVGMTGGGWAMVFSGMWMAKELSKGKKGRSGGCRRFVDTSKPFVQEHENED